MFGYKARINLESYIILLFLDDDHRETHVEEFKKVIKQTEAKNAMELGETVHNIVAHTADAFAEDGSLLEANGAMWNYKTSQK